MTEAHQIVANLVPEDARLSFLPSMFGVRKMLRGEMLVYRWMEKLSADYGGGLWDFFTTTNGAMYMAPHRASPMRISVDGNGFEGTLSADAAGIVATLFALNHLAAETSEDRLIDLYYLLRDFAFEHTEATLIAQAID